MQHKPRLSATDRIEAAMDHLAEFVASVLTKERWGEEMTETAEYICDVIEDARNIALECAELPAIPGVSRSYKGSIRDKNVSITEIEDGRWRTSFTSVDGDCIEVVAELEVEAHWIAEKYHLTGQV